MEFRPTCLHAGGAKAGGATHERAHELGQEALRVRPPVPAAAQPRLRPAPAPMVLLYICAEDLQKKSSCMGHAKGSSLHAPLTVDACMYA